MGGLDRRSREGEEHDSADRLFRGVSGSRGDCRRVFLERTLRAGAVGAAALWTPGVLADELTATASSRSLEGPFYPRRDAPRHRQRPAHRQPTPSPLRSARSPTSTAPSTTRAGTPLRNAFVEIWQCDANQNYRHSRGAHDELEPDANFQGYGRFLTNAKGEYYSAPSSRAVRRQATCSAPPHIHFAASRHGERLFTSQMLVNGHPDNARDRLTQRIEDPVAKETILVDFDPPAGVEDRRADRPLRHRARARRWRSWKTAPSLGPRPV